MRTALVLLALSSVARGDSWEDGIAAWRARRAESIGGPTGWVTLVARSPLRAGENRIGSDAKNDVVLPHAPPYIGSIFVEGDTLRIVTAPGVALMTDNQLVGTRTISDDRDGKPTMMTLGPLTLHVIKRQSLFALRVKDRESPARKSFHGLFYYPLDPKLHVRADFTPQKKGSTLPILNVLGQTEAMEHAGTLRFVLDGKPYALEALRESGEDELFILFKDRTSGAGSYGAGRFLYTPLPDANEKVDLDFNRAFTPPCGFTNFATCPFPPAQNVLDRKIEAGERFRH
jgi:uncharacterized protein (DUF1684 family)